MGIIEATVEEQTPLWPNEQRQNQVKYPYRIRFQVKHLIPFKNWCEKRLSIQHLHVPYYRGANIITNADTVREIKAYFS